MDGLECSEISKIDLERTLRIDAEFYQKENLNVEKLLQKTEYFPLTKFTCVSDGNHMAISDRFITDGIPYYRGQDVKSFFIEDSQPICIDEESFSSSYMMRSHLQKGDVLLSIVGTIGKLSLVNSNRNATCSCKLAILRPKKGVSGEVIATFLTSKYGQNQIQKYTRGAVQMGLILEDMDQLLVPNFSNEFVTKITELFADMNQAKTNSIMAYEEANRLLLERLSIETQTEGTGIISTSKLLSESFKISGRLDAEYYQPKYEQIETAIKRGNYTTLDKISDIETGEFVSETLYINSGVPYIRGTDITSLSIDMENAVKVEISINDLKTIEVEELAFAMIGSVGNVSINRTKKAIVSNNLGTIKPHNSRLSNYLLAYLTSDLGQALFEKYQTRTAQPKIRKEDVGQFLVPLLPNNDVEFISKKINESFELKEKSKKLLDVAIKTVEMAIETNEETALIWLESQV